MNKEVIKSLIIEKQAEISRIKLMKRAFHFESTCNYVLVGLRRAGKSYLLYQIIQEMVVNGEMQYSDLLFVNFEDDRIAFLKTEELQLIIDSYYELFGKKPIIFLDEIQNVLGWEMFARRLADAKYRVFITGSNAKMLSKEIYTTLGGRFLVKEVFPFNFNEYLNFKNILLSEHWQYSEQKYQVQKEFANYFLFGGFAEIFEVEDKRNWLQSLYQKILLGDIVLRNKIRNELGMQLLCKKIAENLMQPTSLSRLACVIEASGVTVSRNTVSEYINYMEQAYLIFGISNYNDKFAEKVTFKKRYFFDNGLLNNLLVEAESKLLENIVAITLYKNYKEGLFYYYKNVEVDFFVPAEKLAIQVSYSIENDYTRERELKSLRKLSDAYEIHQKIVITHNEEGIEKTENGDIEIVPIWKWLLKFN